MPLRGRAPFAYSARAARQTGACLHVSQRKDLFLMPQWKNLATRWRGRVDNSVEDTQSYFAGGWLGRGVLLILLVYLLISALVGWYWSQEPDMFPVQQQAQQSAEQKQRQL